MAGGGSEALPRKSGTALDLQAHCGDAARGRGRGLVRRMSGRLGREPKRGQAEGDANASDANSFVDAGEVRDYLYSQRRGPDTSMGTGG